MRQGCLKFNLNWNLYIQKPHCLNNLDCTLIHIELQAVQEHLKNPAIMEKIMKLKDAGLISMSYR